MKPEFWESESNGRLHRDHRLLFIGLFNVADDHGRFRAAIPHLSGLLFPFDEDGQRVVSEGLDALRKLDKIELWRVGGFSYGEITKFKVHQKIDQRRKTQIPDPPKRKGNSEKSAPEIADSAPKTADSAPKIDVGREGKGRDQGRDQGGEAAPATPPALPDAEVLTPSNAKATLEKFLLWVAERRTLAKLPPDRPFTSSAWWDDICKKETMHFARMRAAYNNFLRDNYWRDKTPPWPIEGFAAQALDHLPAEQKRNFH